MSLAPEINTQLSFTRYQGSMLTRSGHRRSYFKRLRSDSSSGARHPCDSWMMLVIERRELENVRLILSQTLFMVPQNMAGADPGLGSRLYFEPR